MDLLYSRYASPLEFMKAYIEQGRFGEFVNEILEMDYKRKKQEAEKEEDSKLWLAYVHTKSDLCFNDWKESLKQKQQPEDYSMTNDQVAEVKEQAMGILKRISPV